MRTEDSPYKCSGHHPNDGYREVKVEMILEGPSQKSSQGIDKDEKNGDCRRSFGVRPAEKKNERAQENPAAYSHNPGKNPDEGPERQSH